ncbi:GFA family protein [Tabrizicola sp.]|uniref:GFA family protein n=1 Tax=Tabrizicola sp. TaxID=2005166 RepID=UPI003F371D92
MKTVELSCRCGGTRLEVQGEPFLVSECLCTSCRAAAARLAQLPGSAPMLTTYEATATAEYRKDRVKILTGVNTLKEFRLTPTSGSRRCVATCCNTPMFLEMKGAHWLSVYLNLWPTDQRPKPQLRTMTGDLHDPSGLPQDIPNLRTHSPAFYAKLFAAWAAMGFRNPKIEVKGVLDV